MENLTQQEESRERTQLEILLENQEKHQKRQEKWMKWCAVCMTGIFAVVLTAAIILLPKGFSVLNKAERITAKLDEAMPQVEEIVEKINEGNPKELMENINSLTQTGEQAITESVQDLKRAIDVLESIDINSLNSAVKDLRNVVSPLARLFGGK